MSITEPMSKASKSRSDADLLKDPRVRSILTTTMENGSSGLAQLEIMMLEGALEDLHKHRNKIRATGTRAVRGKKTKTKKFYRAVAKTRFKTGIDVPEIVWIRKDRMITIPEYKREDGTLIAEHQRRLPEGHSASEVEEREDAIDEFEAAKEYQREQERKYGIDRVDQLTEQFFDGENAETYHGAISAFLNESTIGQGITAVAGFFADQGSKFQFAARAINEFGPWAGTRLAFNYFRYGGYDVPMSEKNGKVKTEMGDTLPEVKSQKETRKWAINTLRKRLPGQTAEDSDAEPPSEGFLIDKDGNVLVHGVGRGNDHFLPFNSKHLKRMREEEGAEYVRRRMYGGPTSEDLHAAMMMGVDRLTVISNVGEFTVELKKRSHGLKMEHMQVLSRFQNILDQKDEEEELDFKGYNSALDTLEAEFPLHFHKAFAEGGDWDERPDRIRPENRFIEGLRDIFNTLAGVEYEEEDETPRSSSTTGRTQTSSGIQLFDGARRAEGKAFNPKELPWRKAGLDRDTWFRRERDKGRQPEELLGNVINSYRRAGLVPPKHYIDLREKQRQGGSITQRQQSSGAGRRALSTPDATTQAARRSQPQAARFAVPPEAQRRADRIFGGIDLQGFDTGNTEHARELANVLHNASDEELEELRDDRSFLDDLMQTFPHVTR